MARWILTIEGKGIRQASVEKLAKKMQEEFGKDARILVEKLAKKMQEEFGKDARILTEDGTIPTSRPDRFMAAQNAIGEARSDIESLRDELQEWLDGLPENLQQGGKASELEDAIWSLDGVISDLENIESADVAFPGMFG